MSVSQQPDTQTIPQGIAVSPGPPLPPPVVRASRSRGGPVWLRFGLADLLGPLAVAMVVVTVCIWVRNQGLISLAAGWDRSIGSFGLLTGLVSSVLMVVQVLLMARIPWVEQAWGHDVLAHRHRWVGFVSFWLMMIHVVAFAVSDLLEGGDPVAQMWSLFVLQPWMLWATVGTIMIIVVVVTSIRAARRRMRYESWHLLHLYAYLGMAFGFPHQLVDGTDFHDPWAIAYWWLIYMLALAAILVFRVGLPVWRSVHHRIEVVGVRSEAPGVVSILMRGRDMARLRTRSGQFFIWRFRTGPGWMRGNPYTISAAPQHDQLRITVQAVGDASARATGLAPGTKVAIEGPYGSLTADRREHPRMLLMAAGVGVAPIRALVEDAPYDPGDVALVYRYTRPEQAVFLDELTAIAARRGVDLHLLPGPRRGAGSWLPNGFGPRDDVGWLHHHVPDIADRDVFVCGPPKWNAAVRAALRAAGARRRAIHSEEFSW